MKVIAVRPVYYGDIRRRIGDVFSIADQPRRAAISEKEAELATFKEAADKSGKVPQAFSSIAMRRAPKGAVENVSTAAQGVATRNEELKKQFMGDPEGRNLLSGDDDGDDRSSAI
jgi:hypothetical protein